MGMRIVSLLPSATEIVCALGLTEALVGVTHECDYPPDATGKPVLTASHIHGRGLTSAAIDHAVSTRLGSHQGLYELDEEMLRVLQPDLVLTQELCDVCAVSYTKVQQAARFLDATTRVVSLEPTTLEAVLDNIALVGRLTGREREAAELVTSLRGTPARCAGAALDGEPAAAGMGLRMAGSALRGGSLGFGAGGLGRRAGGVRTAGAPVGPDQAGGRGPCGAGCDRPCPLRVPRRVGRARGSANTVLSGLARVASSPRGRGVGSRRVVVLQSARAAPCGWRRAHGPNPPPRDLRGAGPRDRPAHPRAARRPGAALNGT